MLLMFSVSITHAENIDASSEKMPVKTDLQDKYYRQALFHYFQNNTEKALTELMNAQSKMGNMDDRSTLFSAGLQLNQGLLRQATESLQQLIDTPAPQNRLVNNYREHSEELLQVVLLNLTEQYLAQGKYALAQSTLKKVEQISASYFLQYYVLNQLAHWPNMNDVSKISVINAEKESISTDGLLAEAPYIQLNNALMAIEQAQYSQAINTLVNIRDNHWFKPEVDFWQGLFKEQASAYSLQEDSLQRHAIKDYARLLLAQVYTLTEQFELAYLELQSFPKNSVYQESAMYVFANSAAQIKQDAMAFNLYSLHYTRYPFSSLAWQSALLMAAHVSSEQSLAQGIVAYESIEAHFLSTQTHLEKFKQDYSQSKSLIQSEPETDNVIEFHNSPWLKQALLQPDIAGLYRDMITLAKEKNTIVAMQTKNHWLAEVIELNKKRKQRVSQQKEQRNYSRIIDSINETKRQLAVIIAQGEKQNDTAMFANATEHRLLERIANSQMQMKLIANTKDVSDYQQRLDRVQGVLAWQLSENYPTRLWQHKKQLHQTSQLLLTVQKKNQQFNDRSFTLETLDKSLRKQQQISLQLEQALLTLNALESKLTTTLRAAVMAYIETQNKTLNYYLLSTRRGLAKTLEAMAEQERKISKQLRQHDAGNLGRF